MIKRIFLSIFIVLFYLSTAFAATEFTATVKSSGGDYTTLQLAETGLQNDITAATIKVFSISAYTTPTLVAGDTVLGQTSAATGVVVLVNAARTQILIKTIAVAAFQSGEVVKKTTDAAVTVTLSNAGDSPIIGIACYASAAPDGATTIDGSTTSATNYIKIYTPTSERHSGVYNTSKYRIETTLNATPIVVSDGHVQIDGLQLYLTSSNAASPIILKFQETASAIVAQYYITNNIIRGHTGSAQATYRGIFLYDTGGAGSTAYIYNNLIYDISSTGDTSELGIEIFDSSFSWYLYNNTIRDITGRGVYINGTNTVYMKNNLFDNNTGLNVSGTVDNSSNNNGADDALGYTCTCGANDRASVATVFVAESEDDFHLSPADTGSRNYGTSLAGTFTTDVDGQTRPGQGTWDIGFDEVFPNSMRFNFEDWE